MTLERKQILVGVAWPYVNGEKHIGQIAGAYLPPDIFARFMRMMGHEVLMVSGSDAHGTPIVLKADAEGISPAAVVEEYHQLFVEGCLALGLTFDLYTHTDTQNHWDVTQMLFKRHLEADYIYRDRQKQLFDPQINRFLADRYVEGTCPVCGYPEARGDQCDNCGSLFDALELKNPRSKITGNTALEIRESEHFFLDLGRLNEPLLAWIGQGKEHWRPNVLNFTRGQLQRRELHGRAITRDIDWGVTIPVAGVPESKRIYVWYDAVIGYLSATVEWATLAGEPEGWRRFWDASVNPGALLYNFIGKDNIPFHTIIWPGMLLAYNDGPEPHLNLPSDVPANEYLNLGGGKFSTSRGNVIGWNTVLGQFQPDAWRYVLTVLAPETADVEFTWHDFMDRVNNELLANWGNLVNRILGFAYKRYAGQAPQPGPLDESDAALLAEIKAGFENVGALYAAVKLKAACIEVRRLSQRVNQYLNEKEPWKRINSDPTAAATSVYVALQAIDWLSLLWAPILPHSSEAVHTFLGYDRPIFGRQYTETIQDGRGEHLVLRYDHSPASVFWVADPLLPGQRLREPKALFTKLEPANMHGWVEETE
ncbi:MAG TPA: methionine--tRNA ligase [Caldilineaceae bacterium]|nr:methionine--tRNA ligase [Caldilineaceae bacterium]